MSIFSIPILLEVLELRYPLYSLSDWLDNDQLFGIWPSGSGPFCGALKTEKVVKFHDILCRRLYDPVPFGTYKDIVHRRVIPEG
jgi:hypothetical protein